MATAKHPWWCTAGVIEYKQFLRIIVNFIVYTACIYPYISVHLIQLACILLNSLVIFCMLMHVHLIYTISVLCI